MLTTQKVSCILSQFEKTQRATRSTKTVGSFLILIFSQYASTKFFLLVLATVLTHRHLQLKKSVKNICFAIFIWLGSFNFIYIEQLPRIFNAANVNYVSGLLSFG